MSIHRGRRPIPQPRATFPPEPQPAAPLTPREELEQQLRLAVERTGSMADAMQLVERRLVEIEAVLDAFNTPARLSTVVLSQNQPVQRDDVGDVAKSVGLLNPTPVTVYLGIGGSVAQPGRRTISTPPNSMLVVPVAAQDLEVGADAADLAAGDVAVHLFRFRAVQSLFFRSFEA